MGRWAKLRRRSKRNTSQKQSLRLAEDEALRNNRLALLSSLHNMMNRVADISKLAA